ncbi:MAG: tyrosine-type recombinase/integrase, partial [Candidatus Sulfotelmatobacter sp.]
RPVWVARWREDFIGTDGKIKRVRRSEVLGTKKDFPTKKLVLRELETRVAPVNRPDYRPLKCETFAAFAEQWQKNVLSQHKPSTQSVIKSQLRTQLIPFFGPYLMKDIDWNTVQAFVRGCQGKSPKTCRNYIGVLKMMWKSAKSGGWASHDPLIDLTLPKKKRPNGDFYTAEEAKQIINAANGKYKTLYWLAAETGLRPGELCGLRVSDIDLLKQSVSVAQSVWNGKTQTPKSDNAYRSMAISAQLTNYLRIYLASSKPNSSGLVVASAKGKPLGPSQIMRTDLKPLCIKLGIKPKALKAFRHCSATMMDQAGVPTKVRQERMGHAPGSKVTEIHYTNALGADDRNAAATLGTLLAGSTIQ